MVGPRRWRVAGTAAAGLLWLAASAGPVHAAGDRPAGADDAPPPPSSLLTGWEADGSAAGHGYGTAVHAYVMVDGEAAGPSDSGATSPRAPRVPAVVGGPPPAAIPFPSAVQLFVPGAAVAMYAIRRMRPRRR